MRRNRNAKIVATLGPASTSRETIEALFKAGADVFRLNFSHGTHEDHQRRLDVIRSIEQDAGRPIGVLLDLQGPKLRIGTFVDGPIMLEKRREVSPRSRRKDTRRHQSCRAVATVAYTSSGYSALRMARERPCAPIIGMTPRQATARRLALAWGVHPVLCAEVIDVLEVSERACHTVREEGFGETGQTVVISAGVPFGTPGTTNLLRIAQIQ